jgi:DNA mismatch repair protein MutS2
VRDKRYWEGKRQTIHQHEKNLEGRIARYESSIEEIEQERKAILRRAKEQAEELLRESNRKIENAIREIREQQAEKEATRRIREELTAFKEEIDGIDTKENDEMIARKMRQIQERRERKEKRRSEKQKEQEQASATGKANADALKHAQQASTEAQLKAGDTVRIKGLTTIGKVESIDGKMATVIFGDMRTKMRAERLEHAKETHSEQTRNEERNANIAGPYANVSSGTRNVIDNRKTHFHQDLDVRGMRGDEAINAVTYFIDDAILVGMSRVRILHGTGSGILRQLIRQYLATVPNVSHFHDEHVQFGGAGITVVDLD